jgi:hypothetical protein
MQKAVFEIVLPSQDPHPSVEFGINVSIFYKATKTW